MAAQEQEIPTSISYSGIEVLTFVRSVTRGETIVTDAGDIKAEDVTWIGYDPSLDVPWLDRLTR